MKWIAFLWLCLALDGVPAEVRTWTEAASGRTLEAEFVSSDGEMVELRRASDRRRFALALAALSEADQEFVAEQDPGDGSLPKAKADRFEDLEWKSSDEIPIAGDERSRFKELDAAIAAFMVEKGIGAAVAAVSRDGKVLYDRAFGYQDAKLKRPIKVGTTMRLASISKPITAAAVKTLIRDRKMKEADTVWDLLKLEERAPRGVDERWKSVTVGHLLKHEGGWDRDASGDFSFRAQEIAKDVDVVLEDLNFDHFLEFMLKRPLDFDPGSKDAYSNFGYSLLAQVCATVSGQSWEDYLRKSVAKEAEMPTLVVSPTEVDQRVAGETWYHYHPEYDEEPSVMPLRMEFKNGSGSLSCSAADLCRFLETYWISGELRGGGNASYNFFGSMPGTTSVSRQRTDGVNYAVITNRRDRSPSDWNEELKVVVDRALEAVRW